MIPFKLSVIMLAVAFTCSFRGDDDFEPLFPFGISYDSPDNIVNMSGLLGEPAGKYGFIRVANGRFVNDAGPVRLNGTNLTGPANFPTARQAERMAGRLARFGINCVRLHYMDEDYGNFLEEPEPGLIADDPETKRKLDSIQLDRLDYLIAQFKKRGIYVNINLHVARKWDERDGFTGAGKRPKHDKGLDNFLPEMIELQKEYARRLLSHVNPYTKIAYRDDPCVAMVEINNENGLLKAYFKDDLNDLPAVYVSEFQRQWNDWLREKYRNTAAMLQAWYFDSKPPSAQVSARGTSGTDEVLRTGADRRMADQNLLELGSVPVLKTGDSISPAATRDFIRFLYDTEAEYWQTMYDFLKKELKVKSMISGGQLGFTPPTLQAQLDFVDNHAYWRHPGPVNERWRIKNEPMVNSMGAIRRLAAMRVAGLPYTVSEYNHPFPNQYGAEAQPMLRAYGRLHGWDGVFQYTYAHRSDVEPEMNTYFFSMAARTDVLAHMPACAAIFLRGDVSEAKESVVVSAGTRAYIDNLVAKKQIDMNFGRLGADTRLALLHKTAIRFSDTTNGVDLPAIKVNEREKVLLSDNGELQWNTEDPDSGYFVVNTANTKLFSGFPAGRTIAMGEVELSVGKTRLNWATVSLLSKTASGFGETEEPARILLAATGLIRNKDMEIVRMDNNVIKLADWGRAPVMVEGIPAKISLPADAKRTKCYALDERGERKFEVPAGMSADGKVEIEIKPAYKTVWYEIVIK